MSKPQIITLQETQEELNVLFKKSSIHLRPRIKMLQLMYQSIFSIDDLAVGVGVSRNSIAKWKRNYKNGGIESLLE
ncbi:MAG TPA: helix-turn-helix domain-containing protein, partial [Edaphocola sp.]|nr:helix-turn-helix domain-containing protein [Edaphocola sp.]